MERVYIYIQDLVGNLYITLMQNGYNIDTVSYDLIDKYAIILDKKFKELDILPIFVLSRMSTEVFLDDYDDIFEETNNYEIRLINNPSIDDLIDRFHGYIPLNILKVVLDKDVINKTIELYDNNRPKIDVNKVKILTNKKR